MISCIENVFQIGHHHSRNQRIHSFSPPSPAGTVHELAIPKLRSCLTEIMESRRQELFVHILEKAMEFDRALPQMSSHLEADSPGLGLVDVSLLPMLSS